MKRLFCVLLVAVMLFGLCACGGNNKPNSPSLPSIEPNSSEGATSDYWPKNDIAELLPTPEFAKGKVSWENSGGFYLEMFEVTKDGFSAYVDACREKGFKEDYSRGDDYYYADNPDGYHISLNYNEIDEFNSEVNISLRVDAPDEDEISEEPSEEPTPEPSEEPSEEPTPEPSEEPTEEPQASGTVSGDLGDHHVEITGASLTKSYDDRPVIVVTYAWTNNSEDTTSAMVALLETAYQDGIELDSAIILNDSSYDLTSSTKNIRPGTTIDIQNAYYLDSETSTVEFEISELFSFLSDDSITATFDPSSLS